MIPPDVHEWWHLQKLSQVKRELQFTFHAFAASLGLGVDLKEDVAWFRKVTAG